jgi:hypothetical protein
MSIRVMSHVWQHSRHKGSDLLLLLAIADFADDAGIAYPSVPTLAVKTRLKVRNVQYRLRALEQSQELSIHLNAGPNGVHLYRIHLANHGVQTLQGVDETKTITPEDGGANFAGGVQSLQGARHCTGGVHSTAPNPSLNRHKNKNNSLPLVGSFPDGETQRLTSGTTLSPPRSRWLHRLTWEQALKKDGTAYAEGWFFDFLTAQERLWQRPAFVLNGDWWHDLEDVHGEFDGDFLAQEFARMRTYFGTEGNHRPTSARGWKRFLRHWFEVAFTKQAREAKVLQRRVPHGASAH